MSSLGDLLNDWDDKAQGVRREINKMLTNKIALDGKQVLCTQKWEKKEERWQRSVDGIYMSWPLFSQWYKVISSDEVTAIMSNGLVECQNRLLSSA